MQFIYLQNATFVDVQHQWICQVWGSLKTLLNEFLIIEENIVLKNDKLHTFRSVLDTIWPYQE